MMFHINDVAMNLQTVTLDAYRRLCANYLLYWRMIETATRYRCRKFDMGRSLVDGRVFRFKKNWSPQIAPLHYNFYLRKRQAIPFMDPNNPRFNLAINIWKRLPLALTKRLGPKIVRGLP